MGCIVILGFFLLLWAICLWSLSFLLLLLVSSFHYHLVNKSGRNEANGVLNLSSSWHKDPMLSWILSDTNIILLVKSWEHDEPRVPHIAGFTLWSTSDKRSSRRGVGGITCYIKNNIAFHIQLHKIDPLNQ